MGFGVGVEEEREAVFFLFSISCLGFYFFISSGGKLTVSAKAMHLETKAPDSTSLVVIIPNLHF